MDHEQEEKLKNLQVSLQFKEASLNSLREVLATNLFHLPLSSASFICLSDYRLLSHTLKNFANHNLAAFMHTCVHVRIIHASISVSLMCLYLSLSVCIKWATCPGFVSVLGVATPLV